MYQDFFLSLISKGKVQTNRYIDRCDLDILLKDEWRHKFVLRDGIRSPYRIQKLELALSPEECEKIQFFACNDILLQTLTLLAFHSALYAYGHGNQTAIAILPTVSNKKLKEDTHLPIIPTLVDHEKLSSCLSSTALKIGERFLSAFVPLSYDKIFLGKYFFDASIKITQNDIIYSPENSFPLSLTICNQRDKKSIRLILAYAHDFLNEEIIVGVLNVLKELLLKLTNNKNITFKNLELISKKEKKQLRVWNNTEASFPEKKRLSDLFEEAAIKSRNSIALIFKEKKVTYGQLDAQANYVANQLLNEKIQVHPNEFVALFLDKTDSVISLMLGIWKAGLAFVPIDKDYPVERIRFIVHDSNARFVITDNHYHQKLRKIFDEHKLNVHIINIDNLLPNEIDISGKKFEKPFNSFSSANLAYMTYTSGTTGFPKGAAKTHRSAVNCIIDLSNRYKMRNGGTERVALFASYVFEPFLRQTLIALINSQVLVIVPDEVRLDPDYFPKFLQEQKITYLNGTGSVLLNFDLKRATSLQKLVLVGEELTLKGITQLRQKFSGHIINEYAFTEAAFVTAIKEFPAGESKRPNRSIGRPINNVKCYVLSQNMKQLPIGAIGELYVGGAGLSGRYYNRDDLTKERFLKNPFQTSSEKQAQFNNLIYKTGDLARFLPNGELEYLGRQDFQLKINGVRVEPGEIEAVAMSLSGVKNVL